MVRADRVRSPLAGAVLGGGLLALAFLPVMGRAGIPLLLLAFVPWITAHEQLLADRRATPGVSRGEARLRGGAASGGSELRRHARVGAAFAGTFWALNLSWVLLLTVRIQEVWPVAAWLGQVFLLALLGAGVGAGYPLLRRSGLPAWVAGAGAWMTGEWARGTLLGPLRFPWSPTALPLTAEPILLQPAAWGGEWLLGLAAVATGGLLGAAGRSRRSGPLVAALALLGVWFGVGSHRAAGVEVRDAVEAVVVQPALPLALRRTGGQAARVAVRVRTDSLLQAAAARGLLDRPPRGARLAVLPETHLPAGVPGDSTRSASGLAATGLAALVGAFRETDTGTANSLVYLPAGAAAPGARYDKRALVPGVEWGGADGLAAGDSPAPLPAPGRPGPLICIESAWASLARSTVRAGAGWLVNVTNDAWLAEGPVLTRTPAFAQHPAHLQLRAVETGRGALRVGNNGWSGSVTPLGEWIPALPPHRPGVARVTVVSATGPSGWRTTPWVAWGHRLPGTASAAFLALAAITLVRERRRPAPVDPP